jgi:hypothetical protein
MQNISAYVFNFFTVIEVEAFAPRFAVLSQISTIFALEYSLFNTSTYEFNQKSIFLDLGTSWG